MLFICHYPIYWIPKAVLDSCHNKVTQTGWLKIIKMDSFTVLEAKCLKLRYQHGHVPSEDHKKNMFPFLPLL